MTSDHDQATLMNQIAQALTDQGTQGGMLPLFELLLNAVARLERTQALGAEEYERSEKRLGYANGYKDKSFQTRMGPVQLKVPQTRGIAFYPKSLEKGCRSERALKLAIAEMYIKGVSTRKVQKITQELCGYEISSTQGFSGTYHWDNGLSFPRCYLPQSAP